MLELLLGLSAKAHDHISGERNTRPQLTYSSNLFPVLIERIATFHALEQVIVTCLARNIQVFANFGPFRQSANDVPRHVTRLRGHEDTALEPTCITNCIS